MDERPSHHLICSLGTTSYTRRLYAWDGRTYESRYASAAVARLWALAGGRASVLATPGAAQKHLPDLTAELEQAGLTVEYVEVNTGATRADLLGSVSALVKQVREGEQLSLDITLGLRHLPATYLGALTYLTAFRNVTIERVAYAALDLAGDGPVPLLDVSVLFDLAEWYHAVQAASASGDMRPLQAVVKREVRAQKKKQPGYAPLERVDKALGELAPALAAGLPLETGLAARRLGDALGDLSTPADDGDLAQLSIRPFQEQLSGWAVREGVADRAGVVPDAEELRRELRLVRWYTKRGNLREALLLLREWLVTRALLEAGTTEKWLGYESRKPFETLLHVAATRAELHLGGDPRGVGALWSAVTASRNALAHAGMADRGGTPSAEKVGRWADACEELLDGSLGLAPPGDERVLLTPLGLSPGVLYSALTHLQPDRAVIITSREAEGSVLGTLARAGQPTLPHDVQVLDDPHAGVGEAKRLARKLAPELLGSTRELVVNLTGGTTAMQVAVEEIAQSAAGIGVPLRRVFLADRRPPEEQKHEPYVLGELIEVGQATHAYNPPSEP